MHGHGSCGQVSIICLECEVLASRQPAGKDQTLLQSLLLPILVTPTLLPTPLVEPRYFLVPYFILRSQATDVPMWGLVLEGTWYMFINVITMAVFLYYPREEVGRFMW